MRSITNCLDLYLRNLKNYHLSLKSFKNRFEMRSLNHLKVDGCKIHPHFEYQIALDLYCPINLSNFWFAFSFGGWIVTEQICFAKWVLSIGKKAHPWHRTHLRRNFNFPSRKYGLGVDTSKARVSSV